MIAMSLYSIIAMIFTFLKGLIFLMHNNCDYFVHCAILSLLLLLSILAKINYLMTVHEV